MKKNLRTAILCSLLLSNLEGQGQTKLLQDFVNKKSATIGTFQGIKYREAGFSSLYPVPNSNGTEFWTISDRGVNIDCGNANIAECRPTYDKLYAFPSYAPKIHRIRLSGDSIRILQTIAMKRPDGTPASGLLNPTGFGSSAKEVNSIDTVLDCQNFISKTVPKDIWGIDSEGLVVDQDGNFWISEEGGPTIWKLNKNGVVVKRFTPYAHLPNAQPQDIQIDTVFKYRKNNRGFESLAMTPNGKLYAIIQSPLLYPNKATGEATQVHRMLEIDTKTNATRVLVYMNEGVIGESGANQIRYSDWKIGDMAAINDSTFLVLEAALRGSSDHKKIYKINITSASPVTADLYSGKTVEGLVDMAGLSSQGIVPVKKTLLLDLNENGWPADLDKTEGLAIINDSTIAVSNDNDYAQTCPNSDGIAIPTSKQSHVLIFRLKANDKLKNLKTLRRDLDLGLSGPSSSSTPYLTPLVPQAKFSAILTATDLVGNYTMSGLADGLGAFDNGNGTFTLLMNHEIGNSSGVIRDHGAKGAFVSKWIINKNDLQVLDGSDLIKKVRIWDLKSNSYKDSAYAFSRFCSADLAMPSAFYNPLTGKGTQVRIFLNGEESGAEGKAFAHMVNGDEAGTTYELPCLGKFSWENAVASPTPSDKTLVVGLDDSTPGQVYFYVGNKKAKGTNLEKSGLVGGKLYGLKVSGFITENDNLANLKDTTFSLYDIGDVSAKTGAELNTISNNAGITTFLRPEDGAWDPKNPNDFYFATTNAFASPSRLWKLSFKDLGNPELGGKITAVLNGTEGQHMLDNLTIDNHGHILIQEDPGNNAYIAKMWEYDIATDKLLAIAQHDTTRFLNGGSQFLTQDEESSGIIDMEPILGPGYFLLVDQAHFGISGAVVEGGQLLSFFNPRTFKSAQGAGPSSSQSPYLISKTEEGRFKAIISTTDEVNGYKMVGLPDGLGAFDNGNGTFTVLMNHEIGNTAGNLRSHGAKGSFVSKWTIRKKDLMVTEGADLIQLVKIWNTSLKQYQDSAYAFSRFCSADLAAPTAYFNDKTGLGSLALIFLNGEEIGNEGKAFAHVVTGQEAGVSYELPALGKFSWENSVTSPTKADKTIVAGMDDSTPGQVYFYIGSKSQSGNEIERAGLTNGKLYGLKVADFVTENNALAALQDTTFSLFDLGDVTDKTGLELNTISNNNGVTTFLRPEDGAWDPTSPNDFYFATTNAFNSPSRLWRVRFMDIKNPELGGRISAVLDGTEGQKMLDNLTIDQYGNALLTEDPGNNVHLAKVWQYNFKSDKLKLLGEHDSNRFLAGNESFLTQDEEASGILDVQNILGAGYFLISDQAHYGISGEFVEGGQLLVYFNPDTYKASEIVTEIKEEQFDQGVMAIILYPNPVDGIATFTFDVNTTQEISISVLDLQGKLVLPVVKNQYSPGKHQFQLNTSSLDNGIYSVQINMANKSSRVKTVVSH